MLTLPSLITLPPRHIYLYCESATPKPDGGHQFECKSWGPEDLALQDIADQLKTQVSKRGTAINFIYSC